MTLRVEHGFSPRSDGAAPVALTIGSFDGLHLGHVRLLEETVRAAHDIGGESVVVTFEPNPRCVVDPGNCPQSLTTLDEKQDVIAAHGIDRLVVVEFTREFGESTADTFCGLLAESFALRALVVGEYFALGHHRQGDVPFLKEWGSNAGVAVTVVEPVLVGNIMVSSTLVRRALVAGELARANELLGHRYFIDAPVEHGDRVGTALGYPTANLGIGAGKCLPQQGIYATWLRVGSTWHMAATSIGFRPTFGGDHLTVEAFVLDFEGDLYERPVRAAFVGRLREERTYRDVASLSAQIAIDVEDTRRVLERAPHP